MTMEKLIEDYLKKYPFSGIEDIDNLENIVIEIDLKNFKNIILDCFGYIDNHIKKEILKKSYSPSKYLN